VAAVPATPEPTQHAPSTEPESAWDAPVAPAAGGRTARPVDTGRLYHSAGADGPATSEAIPALPLRRPADPAGGAVGSEAIPAAPVLATAVSATAVSATAGDRRPSGPATVSGADAAPEPLARSSAQAPMSAAAPATRPAGRGLTYLGVVIVVGGATLLVGLIEAALTGRIGWPTGLVLLIASTYAALTVRRADFAAPVVVPSLAFLVTTLIAGQLALESGGSLMVREGYMVFRTLAVDAPWILGATALAAIIVLVRRRKTPTAH
jgi:hypothetical protein